VQFEPDDVATILTDATEFARQVKFTSVPEKVAREMVVEEANNDQAGRHGCGPRGVERGQDSRLEVRKWALERARETGHAAPEAPSTQLHATKQIHGNYTRSTDVIQQFFKKVNLLYPFSKSGCWPLNL
jgi:hypothetical protein